VTAARTYLAGIKERAEGATAGPWRWDEDFGDEGDTGLALTNDSGAEVVGAYNHHCCSFRDDPSVEDNDAEFIAHSRTDLPRVADALLAVLAECDYLDTLADGDKHYARVFRKAITEALEGK
jgi:shikimate kinase